MFLYHKLQMSYNTKKAMNWTRSAVKQNALLVIAFAFLIWGSSNSEPWQRIQVQADVF